MLIGGLQKFSLLDYPEHLSAIIFTQGCNFRCQFCYNPMLVWPIIGKGKLKINSSAIKKDEEAKKGDSHLIAGETLFTFLKDRVNKLDAVVITGGEPTMHNDLPEFIKKIRDLGFKVKLDSNGTNPKMLKKLIAKKLIDYVAMDVKASLDNYEKVIGVNTNLENIEKSIKIIKESNLPHEFRTTLVPGLVVEADIRAIGELIKGKTKWYLQNFKSDIDLVGDLKGEKAYTNKEMQILADIGKEYVDICEIR